MVLGWIKFIFCPAFIVSICFIAFTTETHLLLYAVRHKTNDAWKLSYQKLHY